VITKNDILHFWLEEAGEKAWYDGQHLDAAIAVRFEPVWRAARAGKLDHWRATPEGTLAFLILTDQFPRNMFRGTALSFASDPVALSAAKIAVRTGFDRRIKAPERQFFYLPMMHSEILADQDQCLRRFLMFMPEEAEQVLHARAHRAQIRAYGRFPSRNAALGRTCSDAEKAFLDGGGYPALVRSMRAARDAALT
jgi:uncharacterized protein (DUF924 family)